MLMRRWLALAILFVLTVSLAVSLDAVPPLQVGDIPFGQDAPPAPSYRVVESLPNQPGSLRPPPAPPAPPSVTGMSLPLPPPEKALAAEGPPPVPFGRARELLGPAEDAPVSSLSDWGNMYSPYGYEADPYGMGMDPDEMGGYYPYDPYDSGMGGLYEPDPAAAYAPAPLLPTAPVPPSATFAPAPPPSSFAPSISQPIMIDPFPRSLGEMPEQEREALHSNPEYDPMYILEYDSLSMHEKVQLYSRVFEQTRGRKPQFDRSILAEARASAPPPSTIREANQHLYRSPANAPAGTPDEYGKMDSLRGLLRRDLLRSR